MSRLGFAAAAVSMLMMSAAPALAAQATSASRLSVANARVGAATQGSNKQLGEGAGGIIALGLLAGIGAIVVLAAIGGGNGDDSPDSN